MSEQLVIVAKRNCPTCTSLEPVYAQIAGADLVLRVYRQDDPSLPESIDAVIDDTALETSYRMNIEFVPTLSRIRDGVEVAPAVGWNRADWEDVSGVSNLGAGLVASQPGGGANNVEPGMVERLMLRFGDVVISARAIQHAACGATQSHLQRRSRPTVRLRRSRANVRSSSKVSPLEALARRAVCMTWPTSTAAAFPV